MPIRYHAAGALAFVFARNKINREMASFFEDQPIEALPFSDQERTLIESFRTIKDRKIKECLLEFSSFAGKR